jgi:hypothetical protein
VRKHNPDAVSLRRGPEPLRRGRQIAAVTFPEGWGVNRVRWYRSGRVPTAIRRGLCVQADLAIGSVPRGSQISSTRDTAVLETSIHLTAA